MGNWWYPGVKLEVVRKVMITWSGGEIGWVIGGDPGTSVGWINPILNF